MTTHVLILCTHNSARSVLAEGMLNHWGKALGRDVRAFSAGSAPSGRVHPYALEVLGNAGIETFGLRSKSWDEFTARDAPRMRVVITVCDSAAAEQCPHWPGSPVKDHWSYADPSHAPGTTSRPAGSDAETKAAFELTRQAIGYRMLQLLRLPIETTSDGDLQAALATIRRS